MNKEEEIKKLLNKHEIDNHTIEKIERYLNSCEIENRNDLTNKEITEIPIPLKIIKMDLDYSDIKLSPVTPLKRIPEE